MTWQHGRQTPDNNLMRFVARKFSSPAVMLDIGSGEGANARELLIRKHAVITLDVNPATNPEHCIDIRDFDGRSGPYDCVYDINTLCHVPGPPFEKIKSWLKPGGFFFSIFPTSEAPDSVCEGKNFTRRRTLDEAAAMLRPVFPHARIWYYLAPDFIGNYLSSWVVEAQR